MQIRKGTEEDVEKVSVLVVKTTDRFDFLSYTIPVKQSKII